MKVIAKAVAFAAVIAVGLTATLPASAVDVQAYVKEDVLGTIKISPTGEYLALTVPTSDRTALMIRRRADMSVTATVSFGKDAHVGGFWWVSPDRVLISLAIKIDKMERPWPTGELYAINADGSRGELLLGQRMVGRSGDTRIQQKKVEHVAGFLIDDLPNDDKHVLIGVTDFTTGDKLPRIEKLDVLTGHRTAMGWAPVRNTTFTTDSKGVVRFAEGHDSDDIHKLFYRASDTAEWELINHAATTNRAETALGFSEDGRISYLLVQRESGPDAIVAMDVATRERSEVLRDDDSDPDTILYQPGTSTPVGAVFMDGKPRMAFFDPSSADARLYRSLETAFGGDVPYITSTTTDGRLNLVQTYSDRNPGDFFVFDKEARKADLLISRRNWLNPKSMAPMQPIALKARDGMALNGYLTIAAGADGKQMPLVVLVHGGPFGVRDSWEFDPEVQMLAAAGYAVLQVNYRGSGGYGLAFKHAGARQWGGAMQDDVTDATRWAIEQGIADPKRICIYGGSYGAYAALMGVAKEPDLYRCAVGYVGVYDLPTMHDKGDIQERGSGQVFLRTWIGDKEELAAVSPNRIADRIKTPVFLAAGGLDERTPVTHTKLMEAALKKAGVPVETLYYDTEGHSFYLKEHRQEYYTRLLAFLARHIGGSVASVSSPASGDAK